METVKIKDEFIKLGQAMKLANMVSERAEAKFVINDGEDINFICFFILLPFNTK